MTEMGKYLYCIIRCEQDRTFDLVGIGNDGSMVHTISCKGLAAVVSDTAVKQYESTRKNMIAHERVLEGVMKEFTLLPVRFGTIANSISPVESIQKLLEKRLDEFNMLLEDIENKVELSLKAMWRDEKAIFDEIVAENTDIRRLRDSLANKSPEATHFERIRLGEMVKKALTRKRADEAAKILPLLRQLAHNVRENDILLDRMVVNAAFLVDKAREAEFDQAINRLDEQFGRTIVFNYIGPTPPYNFINITVDWQN